MEEKDTTSCAVCDSEIDSNIGYCENCENLIEEETSNDNTFEQTKQIPILKPPIMPKEIKCPNCKAKIQANTTVCEWCNFVINQDGDKSIENITNDLEEIIKSMKGIENPTLLSSFKKNAKISMPVFTIASFILAYKVNGWFAVFGIFFLLYSLISVFKKSSNPIASLRPLKASFDEKVRDFQNLYGVNNKYKSQIQQYQNEWKTIESAATKGRTFEWISYGVIISIFSIAFALPEPKTNSEINNELVSSETESMMKVDSLLNDNNLDLAKKELLNIKSNQNSIELKSKIQLKEIELKLQSIEDGINNSDLDSASSELSKVSWVKISQDYDSEQYEQKYFKQFIVLKSAINDKLPENKKVKVEDEFDF